MLNNGVIEDYLDKRTEVQGLRLLVEHDCRFNSVCSGFSTNPGFAGFSESGPYKVTYSAQPYVVSNQHKGYLPELVGRSKNSYLCVGRKNGTSFVAEDPSAAACLGGIPAGVAIMVSRAAVPPSAVVLYQNKP